MRNKFNTVTAHPLAPVDFLSLFNNKNCFIMSIYCVINDLHIESYCPVTQREVVVFSGVCGAILGWEGKQRGRWW